MAEVKKVSVNTDEEALIKKRLLTQTTTARPGADPPVKKLTKKYVAYVNALAEDDANGDGADAERAREAWLKEIALYEFNMGRYRAVASANAREMEQYASASAATASHCKRKELSSSAVHRLRPRGGGCAVAVAVVSLAGKSGRDVDASRRVAPRGTSTTISTHTK